MGALLLGVVTIAISLLSLILLIGTRESLKNFHAKRSVFIVGACLAILGIVNMFDSGGKNTALSPIELYIRIITAIIFFFLIYKAVYGEIKLKAKRRERELEALNDVAMAVGKSMDLKQVLHNALTSVTKIGNFGIGFVYLLNEETGLLELVASYGQIPEHLMKKLAYLKLGQEV
ncbi:MAG: hypothetical protein K6T91_01085 [Firmicutes bacterium]|nr:hypothetical protein [Bacillota bacterium]